MKYARVDKIADKTIIYYNQYTTINNISLSACSYVVNGKGLLIGL